MKRIYSILVLGLLFHSVIAQIDTEFWFAAPEVTDLHDDQPIRLRFSSFDKEASITVSFPANEFLGKEKLVLAPQESGFIDLTIIKNQLENIEPNKITNKGILIESTSEITAYYEVSANNNPDIFTLKGRNALGRSFMTPFQNYLSNQVNIEAYASIDIVATQDTTVVFFTPSVNVVGHLAGVKDSVILDKGQTFSIRSLDTSRASRPVGTLIESSKPIAVTIKDDSVLDNISSPGNSSWDLIGDQLVPISTIGSEYVLTYGRGFLLAVEDNTTISVGTDIYNLDKGEQLSLPEIVDPQLIISDNDKPIYVLQVGGIGPELGGAILPPLKCTGAKRIPFTETGGEFILMIIAKKGSEASFTLNGDSNYITEFDFNSVGSDWVAAEVNLSGEFRPGEPLVLENSMADFHLGIRNGTSNTGARFGYFSDFGVLDLGDDQQFCEGNIEENVLDAGISKDSYLWNTGGTSQSIAIDTAGEYIVTVSKGECVGIKDTVVIEIVPNVSLKDLGIDTSICFGDTLVLIPSTDTTYSFLWSDDSRDSILSVSDSGLYFVEVTNEYDCSKSDSILIDVIRKPKVVLGQDTIACLEDEFVLSVPPQKKTSFLWSNGSTDTSIIITETGLYSINATNKCGSDFQSIAVDFWDISIPNIITPNSDGKNDSFVVSGIEQGEWDLKIQNRWGDEVYSNPTYKNTFSPKGISSGMYYYHLTEPHECNNYFGWLLIQY